MGAYPTSPRAAFLEWCQAYAPVFTANATNIGLTTAQATAFNAAATAAAAALLAQQQAHQAALVATQAAGATFGTLRSSAGDVVRLIRAYAESTSKPITVYNLAQIPPPASPSPMPPPVWATRREHCSKSSPKSKAATCCSRPARRRPPAQPQHTPAPRRPALRMPAPHTPALRMPAPMELRVTTPSAFAASPRPTNHRKCS